ncbi:hypothetical protein B0J11DRAFT_73498 [Dendryphion nanum]|uniref:Heterokaryon incompatibility domain-containing protein n=1 Tax=Dendryphion nanum TaxID=256645 RepID=A0A9P9DIE4_9PLEO|nr:hypothetical protein B0J11DRAFT_73498 [Dendryphion nanum]
MSRCKCISSNSTPSWCPARLICIDKGLILHNGEPTQLRLHVVEMDQWESAGNDLHYVTLSHFWGLHHEHQLKLTLKNIDSLRRSIPLQDLPRTFLDAIEFASLMPEVGYVWIDSLCIKQGSEGMEDWLVQSSTMDRVYG